jgi:hypothetical protein
MDCPVDHVTGAGNGEFLLIYPAVTEIIEKQVVGSVFIDEDPRIPIRHAGISKVTELTQKLVFRSGMENRLIGAFEMQSIIAPRKSHPPLLIISKGSIDSIDPPIVFGTGGTVDILLPLYVTFDNWIIESLVRLSRHYGQYAVTYIAELDLPVRPTALK